MRIARGEAFGRQVGLSGAATLSGWLAAVIVTLPLEFLVLVRNAAPGRIFVDLGEGVTLWAAFTLLVVAGVWLVLVLPIALLVRRDLIVRHRISITVGSAVIGALFVADRLDLWNSLIYRSPVSELDSFILHIYLTFAVVFAAVTSLVYSGLLERARPGRNA